MPERALTALALAVVLASAPVLSGCGIVKSFAQAFQSSYHSGFRKGFKTQFVAACTKSGAGTAFCTCAADEYLRRFTDQELQDQTSEKMLEAKASIPVYCNSKLHIKS